MRREGVLGAAGWAVRRIPSDVKIFWILDNHLLGGLIGGVELASRDTSHEGEGEDNLGEHDEKVEGCRSHLGGLVKDRNGGGTG